VNNRDLEKKFGQLSTPLIADAALRLRVPILFAPHRIQPVAAGMRLPGRVGNICARLGAQSKNSQ
jgi:4-hydroxy-4-methyl-2-oxoglutarate aldolase